MYNELKFKYVFSFKDKNPYRYNIEIQNTTLFQIQYKRFGYYGARMVDRSLLELTHCRELKHNVQIILVNGQRNDWFIECYESRNEEGIREEYLYEKDVLLVRYSIFLPLIDKINIDEMNDFELMIFGFYHCMDEKLKKHERKKVIEYMFQ